jgi:hypothetical protein
MTYVFAHLWDHHNLSLYGSVEALAAGLADACDLPEADVRDLAHTAMSHPGEPVEVEQGMSTLRFVSVQTSERMPS